MLKKYLFIIFAFLFLPIYCHAEEYTVYTTTDYHYQSKIVSTGETSNLKIIKVNDFLAYSLDAREDIGNYRVEKDDEYMNHLGQEKIEYMKKIASYGYDEINNNKYLYMAAQELIWEFIMGEELIWENNHGNIINVEEQKDEILAKITRAEDLTTTMTEEIYGQYFSEAIIEDKKSFYTAIKINNKSKNVIHEMNDMLNLIVRESTTDPIQLEKEYKLGTETAVFQHSDSARVITFDITKKIIKEVKVNMRGDISAYLGIRFLNNKKPINGSVTFELVGDETYKFQTDQKGYFFSNILLKEGVYEINVLNMPNEYIFNDTTAQIVIEDDSIDLEQKVIYTKEIESKTGKLEVIRKGQTGETNVPIKGGIYELYKLVLKKAILIGTYETDEMGVIEIKDLPIGKYYILEKSIDEYEPYLEKIEFEIKNQNEIIKKEIVTKHLPLEITIIDLEEYKYYLITEENSQIKEIVPNELNQIYVEYGKYKIEVERDTKKIYTWQINFDKDHKEYIFKTENTLKPIIFDMPKTGRKQTVSNLFFIFFTIIIKCFFKKVKC